MTREQFVDAVAKGMGRAILEVQRNQPTPFEELILDACLHSRQFDPQTEGRRDWYLTHLVEAANLREVTISRLVESHSCAQGWDRHQICYLLAEFAKEGSIDARQALSKATATGDDDAGEELAKVDLQGLTEYVRAFGPDSEKYGVYYVWSQAVDQFGEGPARSAVDAAGVDASGPFWQSVEAASLRPVAKEKSPRLTFDEFKAKVEGGDSRAAYAFARGASDAERTLAANELLRQEEPRKARQYSKVLREAPFPGDLERCIELAGSRSAICSICADVLNHTRDPRVRALGIRLLNTSGREGDGIELLLENSAVEDVNTIRSRLAEVSLSDDKAVHFLVVSLRQFLQKFGFDEAIAMWAYENSPCSFCRNGFAEFLVKEGRATPDLLKEFAWDAEEWTRDLVNPSEDAKST